jgi:hypothetical protein
VPTRHILRRSYGRLGAGLEPERAGRCGMQMRRRLPACRIGCNIDGSLEVQYRRKCNTYRTDYLHFHDYASGQAKVPSCGLAWASLGLASSHTIPFGLGAKATPEPSSIVLFAFSGFLMVKDGSRFANARAGNRPLRTCQTDQLIFLCGVPYPADSACFRGRVRECWCPCSSPAR